MSAARAKSDSGDRSGSGKGSSMNKKMTFMFLLLGATAIILVFNSLGYKGTSKVDVNLVFTTIHAVKSLVFLGFITLGVVIGVLLK